MKYGFSLFLVCIVTAAGVVIWLLGIDPLRQEPQPPPGASFRPKAKQPSKPTRPGIPPTRAVIEPPSTQEVPTLAPILDGDQIVTATEKEAIVQNGNPALSIRRLDHGHDLESLVYTRDRGRELTIISLEDGNVSSVYSQSGIPSAVDAPRPRSDEHTSASLPDPTAHQPASIANAPPAAASRRDVSAFNDILAEVPTPPKPLGRPSAEGTCGEYRDGKLMVKPCSQVPLSPSEWLAKGSGATATESGEAKRK